jgi:hypothetical protein
VNSQQARARLTHSSHFGYQALLCFVRHLDAVHHIEPKATATTNIVALRFTHLFNFADAASYTFTLKGGESRQNREDDCSNAVASYITTKVNRTPFSFSV